MKYPYLKSSNFRLISYCHGLLSVLFIIHSCKKDSTKSQMVITSAAINQAKVWYESTYPVNANGGKLATQGVNSTYDYSQVTKPDWSHAATYSRLGKSVTEMPIDPSSSTFYSALSSGTTGIYPKENSRSSFILLNDGKNYTAYIMTVMADPSYLKGDKSKLAKNTYRKRDSTFTGFVFYFTPKGQYSGGYEFKNGQLLTPAAQNTQSNGKTIQSVGTSNLKTEEEEPVVDCTFYYELTLDDAGNITSQTFLYADCTSTPGGGSGSSGSPGGAGAPPPPTCTPSAGGNSDNAVQSVIINVAQPLPGGGDGGMPPPTTEPCSVTKPEVVDTTTTKDPCAQLAAVVAQVQNAIIAAQDRTILNNTTSTGTEYGANQNATNITGNTYLNTPVTAGTTNSWTPTFTWNSNSGYTIGYSHGHPGGTGPSPDDTFSLVYNLSEQSLINAGSPSLQFYKNNAEVTTETKTGNYIVTVSNWTAIQTLLNTSFSTPAQQTTFDDNYVSFGLDYLTNNPSSNNGDAGAYALMLSFPGMINIYYAQPGTTTYAPLTINASSQSDVVATKPCPNI